MAAADAFAAWLKSRPVDVGATCRRGIRRYMLQGTLETPLSDTDGGNGAAMRNLPIALFTLETTPCSSATAWSRPTSPPPSVFRRGHPGAGRMAQTLILGGGIKECRAIANRLIEQHRQFRLNPYPGRASSYIVDTVQTVLHTSSTPTISRAAWWKPSTGRGRRHHRRSGRHAGRRAVRR